MGPATRFLILANVVAFALQLFTGEALIAHFALWPMGRFHFADLGEVGFRPWQLVTSAFLHGGTTHLLLNMFALWMFGREVEHELGTPRYTVMYFAAVLTAAVVQLIVVSRGVEQGDVYPTVGASGGVFGVLLAFGVLFPKRIVQLLFPPIPMPAWLFVTVYGAIELYAGVVGTSQGVAHFAHLGGMIGAWFTLRGVRRRRPREIY